MWAVGGGVWVPLSDPGGPDPPYKGIEDHKKSLKAQTLLTP